VGKVSAPEWSLAGERMFRAELPPPEVSAAASGASQDAGAGGPQRPPAAPGPPPASRPPADAAGPPTYRRLDPDRLGDHLDRLFRAARALCGNREDAEDLVQETYTKILEKPRWLRSEDDLGYLMRVLRNTHYSRLRAAGRRVRPEPLPDELDRVPDHNAPEPQDALDLEALYGLIAELPDAFREALVAIDLVGLSYREASRALRVREATITTRLYRARQRLARALDEQAATIPA
jgi:RNA polymerase sigma-70 factor, ECF subfamily